MRKEPLDLRLGEAGGRLVENQQPRPASDGAGDGDFLLLGRRQLSTMRCVSRATPKSVSRRPASACRAGQSTPPHVRRGQASPISRFSAIDRCAKARQLLLDRRDAGFQAHRAATRTTPLRPAILIVPASGDWTPLKQLDEGRLASPVLADQADDLAGVDRQIDPA